MSWTESDAAHKLIRRKNKKERDMARKSARQEKSSRDSMNAEHMEMTPDIENYPGLPVVPDSYGTNSALMSGQGVPQWYGSAESSDDIRTASDLVDLADSNNGSLPFRHTMDIMGDNEYLTMIDSDDDEIDFIFLDGTMATCLLDKDTLSTFVVAYESETFDAMARYDPSEDDLENTTLTFAVNFPSFNMEELSRQYLTYQEGTSSKFHMFWLAQDGGGSWYAFNGYARLGYTPRIQRITGPTSQEQAARAMQSKMNAKLRKGYINQSKKFGLRAEYEGEDTGTMMTFGEIKYEYEYEDPSDGPLDDYDAQRLDDYVQQYIGDDGAREGSAEFTYDTLQNGDIVVTASWRHYYSGINSAEEVQAGLPVIPDSYGTNSALSSGQGVPVWYGSADTEEEDFDHSTYEYKEVELAKPFRTAFMASLGFIVAPLVALSGLAFILGEE